MPSFVTTAKLSLIFCVAIQGRSILLQWLRDVWQFTCARSTMRQNMVRYEPRNERQTTRRGKNIPHPQYKVELTRTLSVLLHSQKRQTTGQNILKLIMQRKVHHAAPFMAHVCSKNVYKNIKIRETILVSIQHELSVNSNLCLQLKFSLMQTYPTWSKVDQNVHG